MMEETDDIERLNNVTTNHDDTDELFLPTKVTTNGLPVEADRSTSRLLYETKASTYRQNHWNSDEGPLEYESDPSSDIDKNYFSDEESLTGSMEGGENEDEDTSEPIAQQSRQEKLRMLALRRHLDQLSEQVLEKDYLVMQSREELKKCQEKLKGLELERYEVSRQIEESEKRGNMASLLRLRSQHTKLNAEMEAERDVEKHVTKSLEDAEYALAQATVEQGKFLVAGKELEKDEKNIEKQKAEAAAIRVKKEIANAANAERKRRGREKEHIAAVRERDRRHRQAVTAAKRNRELASKFLKETMSRVRQKEAEEEERSREYMENRMNAILGLKQNIETNKENLRALQARDAKKVREVEEEEEQERQEIISQGLNPDEVLTRRKRIRQFDRDKEMFEKRQRERQVEIVNNILREERVMKKRHQQQPQLWPEKQRERSKRIARRKPKPKFFKSTSGSSSVEYSADVEDVGGQHIPARVGEVSSNDEDDFSPFGETSRDEAKEGDSDVEMEELALPEFRGLWEDGHEKEQEKKEGTQTFRSHTPTKMEKEMMEKALMKQRMGIIQKQVAVGREFKGTAFYSKPEVIIFKDFNVGMAYKKKVLLTNVSYTQNFCKYVGMSHVLKDFVEVFFDPPGAMSAGLTCDFTVTFKPMLNEDLEGQIDFLAQTGFFSVPVKCRTKKCQISLDVTEVDFGTQVLGETRRKLVTVTNSGALGTDFQFCKITGLDKTESSSDISTIGAMTPADGDSAIKSETINPQGEEQVSQETRQNAEQNETSAAINDGNSPEKDLEGRTSSVKFEEENAKVDDGELARIETEGELNQQLPTVAVELAILDGMKVGKITAGQIGAFSSVQLEIIFSPTKPGNALSDFEVMFADPLSPPVVIRARGTGVDVPVWVEREVVDLKICMYDRLYQDSIIVNNRATAALRLKFEVCKELKNHLELLPKTAYIQAESQFSAQLKFLPRHSLREECSTYFNEDTLLLEAPMIIRVSDQTRPVPFTVRATVTSSDIEFSHDEIDFGFCTVFESVRQTITITNKSVLPQKYGFCGVPETVDVQPNDGFGTLLPLESFEVDIIFNAKKAKEYAFDLTCKTGIGREFKLSCRAVGVLPPLSLSHSLIQMKATALGDRSQAHIDVINSHTSSNEFTHPVPRIGTGPISDVGPTSFEFVVPSDAPLTISPAVGTVMPGQRCIVHVTFTPRLEPMQVKQEAVRMMEREAEAERKRKEAASPADRAAEQTPDKKKKGAASKRGKSPKSSSPKKSATPTTPSLTKVQAQPSRAFTVDDVVEGSDDYESAHLALMRQFDNSFSSHVIPCFVASGQCTQSESLSCSVHNTLYLEVHCPAVRPALVVLSESGRTVADFESVSIGQSRVKTITVQNISDGPLELYSSVLDPHGPFQILNALRTLEPQGTHTVILSFNPNAHKEFLEILEIRCPQRNALYIRLKGRGVSPSVSLSIKGGVLDLGDTLVNDTVTSTFTISNTSELDLCYTLKLDSQSPFRHSWAQTLPRFLQPYDSLPEKQRHIVGPSNYNGMAVFDCSPPHGVINPGDSKNITVKFTADHPSEHYADALSVLINDNEKTESILLLGRAWSSIFYMRGWDELMPNVESVVAESEDVDEEDHKPEPEVKLLTLKSNSTSEGFTVAVRTVEIGCIKSNVQTKKSCDINFDNPKEANEKGFSFDPMKAGVDIGTKKNITFKWQPSVGHNPNEAVNTSTTLIVKAENTMQYRILLKGLITSEQQVLDEEKSGDS